MDRRRDTAGSAVRAEDENEADPDPRDHVLGQPRRPRDRCAGTPVRLPPCRQEPVGCGLMGGGSGQAGVKKGESGDDQCPMTFEGGEVKVMKM